MERVRAALYLDFDNVFSGLLKLDPAAATAFAESPAIWLRRLSTSLTVEGPRDWLVRRCYLNPTGWAVPPSTSLGTNKLYFSCYRESFTRAGFDVIDCPSLTHRNKNAADIRMALDAAEAIGGDTRYDEFVIASGDADMTPLLVRLRAADRRTTIVSPSDAAEAFTSIADRLIDGPQTLELLHSDPVDTDGPLQAEASVAGDVREADGPDRTMHPDELLQKFRAIVERRYREADEPVNLSSLAQSVRATLGPTIDHGKWFGFDGFTSALESLHLPQMRLSQHHMWDSSRHVAPEDVMAARATTDTQPTDVTLPAPVARICSLLNVPRLPRESWKPLYAMLSEYASTHEFNLTEATKWSRDRLRERGVDINRRAVGFVTQGAAYGGCPLYRPVPPTSDEIASAFVSNVLARARAADLELTTDEANTISYWLSDPVLADPAPIT